jgi:hypothetical protein
MDNTDGSQMNTALNNITEFLNERNETQEIINLLETFGKYARSFEEFEDIAKSFFKVKIYDRAMKYGESMMTVAYSNDQTTVARSNMINIYNHANYPEKALRLIKLQELINPDDDTVQLEKAYSHFLMNDKDTAEEILLRELTRTDISEETRTKIEFNLGTYDMWKDKFQSGLRRFLLEGEKLDYWRKAKLPYKFWDGGAMPDRDIILYAEAGIGDEIINVRFMKHLRKLGMKPIWLTDRKDIVEIFNANGFDATSDQRDIDRLENPVWTYPMSLPVYLNLQYKDLWYGPYLKSLPEYDKEWETTFDDRVLNIGVRWQGNPDYDQDLHRSIPLAGIMKAIKDRNPDSKIYSLQRDTGLEEMEPYREIYDLSPYMDTFKDTMSMINKLDVIITSCTSVVHMAAAMGKRTILLSPISSYYTWTHNQDQSPWYGDNLTVFRQMKPRSWEEPLMELEQLVRSDDLFQSVRS